MQYACRRCASLSASDDMVELEKTLKVETGQGVSPRAVWHSLENRDGVYKNAHLETEHDTPHKTIHEREGKLNATTSPLVAAPHA